METPGKVLTIILFFILVSGLIVIFQEELFRTEFIGRIQTSPIAGVENATTIGTVRRETTNNQSVTDRVRNVFRNTTTTGISSEDYLNQQRELFEPRNGVRFNSNAVVTAQLKKPVIQNTAILHTIANGVTDYFARGVIREAEDFYKPSPYAGSVVFFDRTNNLKDDNVDEEYFILAVANNINTYVPLVDWKIVDRKRRVSYSIPGAVRILGSSSVQKSDFLNAEAGDIIIVSSGRSPTGFSFKVNKCSGYREQFKNFTPSIKKNCPDPLDDFLLDNSVPFNDNRCYDIVDKAKRCEVFIDVPTGVTKECTIFLEDVLTEEGCVSRHRDDSDFFLGEWRVYLEADEPIWTDEDNLLYLLDSSDRLVATLIY